MSLSFSWTEKKQENITMNYDTSKPLYGTMNYDTSKPLYGNVLNFSGSRVLEVNSDSLWQQPSLSPQSQEPIFP
jgi:hypothetical protein